MPGGLLVGSQVGSYRIDAVIGAGPASIVYRATHVRLATLAAVKVLAPAAAETDASRARFLREIELAASIDHPGVIPILDMDVHEGAPYVVMRHVAGGDLKALLGRTGALPPGRVSTVLGPIGGALDAAHARGLVHGGVRPSNVLLQWSHDGALERVYLTDFAMAGRGSSAVERFDYLAPEQAEDDELTPAVDVYALGCVVYHALTGRAPFSASFGTKVREAQLSEGAEPPSTVRRELPEHVDDPVLRAMEADPRQRFGTCGALMAAVGAALEEAPAGAAERTAASPPAPTAAPPPAPPRPEPTASPREPAATPPPPPPRPAEPAAPRWEPTIATREPSPPPREPTAASPPREPTAAPPAPPPREPTAPPPREPTAPPPREPTAAPPAPVPAASAAGAPPGAAPRRRSRLMTVTIPVIAATILAAGVGYGVSTLGGDDEGGGGDAATAGAGARPASSGSLREIAASGLPDLRCTVTSAPGGGGVVENAACVPKTAGTPPIERVTLTLFSNRQQLDSLYERSLAIAGDAARGGAAGCSPGPWFKDAAQSQPGGRRFCSSGAPGARIVWTANDALVLADAGAASAQPLQSWWITRRNLRPAGQG